MPWSVCHNSEPVLNVTCFRCDNKQKLHELNFMQHFTENKCEIIKQIDFKWNRRGKKVFRFYANIDHLSLLDTFSHAFIVEQMFESEKSSLANKFWFTANICRLNNVCILERLKRMLLQFWEGPRLSLRLRTSFGNKQNREKGEREGGMVYVKPVARISEVG